MPVPTAPSTAIQRHGSVALQARSGSRTPPESEDDDPYNVDEWDPSRGAFWQHAVAGSLAGFAEHSAMFPIDTMKTHMQVRSATTANLYELVSSCGVPRLWRGVQTMFAGCIPAHAAYFSIYETLKPVFTHELEKSVLADRIDRAAGTLGGSTSEAIGAGAAVSVATVAHDVVMTPMDVMKQRLQLGYHDNSMGDAFRAILREQGPRAFVVSLPLTLCINMPYAAVMGTTNETLRKALVAEGEQPSAVTYMTAGGLSGALAAAATAPLDAVKTRLQTQHLAGATTVGAAAAESTAGGGGQPALLYNNAAAAARALYHEGGAAAFYRGVQARMLVHAPAVGLCWTSYETAKGVLERLSGNGREARRAPATTDESAAGGAASSHHAKAETKDAPLPLVDHMIAGSFAGMFEHSIVFPIDTIKTHVQAASAEEAAGGTLATARNLVREYGVRHLFRGLSALLPAIGPAHALMFSGYEQVMHIGGAQEPGATAERVAAVGAAAGVVSTFLHDSCMVPAETIKQRLQLGYYRDAFECFNAMLATGGGSLFRSLPTTLAMNVPYVSLMMASNESIKRWLNPSGEFSLSVFLFAGGFSGAFAAGLTTPLDVVKTRLQVQSLSAHASSVGAAPGDAFKVRYSGFMSAVHSINAESGLAGFWRGLAPRVAMFGPSCAISWVAYESCKELLLWRRPTDAAKPTI